MPGYSRADLERDLLQINKVRTEVAAMIVRHGQVPKAQRYLDELQAEGKITMEQVKAAYTAFISEGTCTGLESQEIYAILDALENGYICNKCGILQGRGVAKGHRRMGHRVRTGCRVRFLAGALAAMDRDEEDKTVHADEDVLDVWKEIFRLKAQMSAGRSQARPAPESQAPVPRESQRYKNEQEIEDPEWRHNLDATKGIGYPAREEGHYGSHPAHDGFDDESEP